MDGLHSSRDIHLEPEMPFYNIVRHVGCPNGNITFPSGTPMCLTVICTGRAGVQMNVTRMTSVSGMTIQPDNPHCNNNLSHYVALNLPIKLTCLTESTIAFVQNTEQGHILIFNELALKIMLGGFNLNSPGTMTWPADTCSRFTPARCFARRNVSLAFQPCGRKPGMPYGNLFRYYSASPNASVIRIDLLDLTVAINLI